MPINQSNIAQKCTKINRFKAFFSLFTFHVSRFTPFTSHFSHSLLFTTHYSPFTRKAFTLAEVLITLGILGVVIAMTIPGLMQNIQDKQFKEAAKEAFSKASQAVQQMRNDVGGDLSYYVNTSQSFKPIFMQYFKVAKDCSPSLCVPNTYNGSTGYSNIYKTLQNHSAYTWTMGTGQFITTDGMFWGIDNWGGHLIITVDVNGYGTPPNVYGRDTFAFQMLNNSLVPLGGEKTFLPNSSTNCSCCRTTFDNENQGLGCMEYVMQGKDY